MNRYRLSCRAHGHETSLPTHGVICHAARELR